VLTGQVAHPHAANKTIFYFLHANPTSVQHVLFAAGPFEMITLGQYENKVVTGFCLPGEEEDLLNSTSFMDKAMSFFSTQFGSYPFQDYKMVFLPEPRSTCSTGATISIIASELLHPAMVLEQAFETRQIVTLAFSQQWFGINIIPRSLSDTWVSNGLAIYLQALFLRQLMGNNEYRYRLRRDMDKCARLDQGDQWPLCVPGTHMIDTAFVNLKAPLVLHILDRHLAKAGTSLGLSRVIPRILLSALSDELSGNMLSTVSFFKTCRKVSGLDLQSFQEQWVYGSGCPHIKIQTNFVRKKFVVDLGIQQHQPAAMSGKRPTTFFEVSSGLKTLTDNKGQSDCSDSRS
jgi:transcription initiation factor TFIID subunit 2